MQRLLKTGDVVIDTGFVAFLVKDFRKLSQELYDAETPKEQSRYGVRLHFTDGSNIYLTAKTRQQAQETYDKLVEQIFGVDPKKVLDTDEKIG